MTDANKNPIIIYYPFCNVPITVDESGEYVNRIQKLGTSNRRTIPAIGRSI
jgi:hypothetical protein